jgi:hypothetical protein
MQKKSKEDTLTPLKLIFNFTLAEPDKTYRLKQHDAETWKIIQDFMEIGLLYDKGNGLFVITDLLMSFLQKSSPY